MYALRVVSGTYGNPTVVSSQYPVPTRTHSVCARDVRGPTVYSSVKSG